MKYLMIACFIFLACNHTDSKKENIVNRQKEINAELDRISQGLSRLYDSATILFRKEDGPVNDSTLKLFRVRLSEASTPLKELQKQLKAENDSLVLELKKY